ncbi:nucleotidyltransferase family protein [Alteribacter populi]|uniref:nucleotidyltransferase family protein n=1 Tax=Alteribacter populi TaxID=2011011 RepID=UPI000BBAF53E|nr:nucleotidyltransferase family protein [Alteribacter populi]
MNGTFSAILLAAGKSTRMGRLKGLLPWMGKTLIEYQLDQLTHSKIEDIVVVLGHRAEQYKPILKPYKVKIIVNEDYHDGKSSSIRKGIKGTEPHSKGIFIAAVDQPVPFTVFDSVALHQEKYDSMITVPFYNGKRGHPVLFSKQLKGALLNVNEETFGLRKVMADNKNQVSDVHVREHAITLNLNTIAAYEQALKMHKNDN